MGFIVPWPRWGDAMCCCLLLSHLADNEIGNYGAGRLVESLGKLTALQRLDLGSTLACDLQGIDCAVLWDGAMRCDSVCV